jgi:hypothetical protein
MTGEFQCTKTNRKSFCDTDGTLSKEILHWANFKHLKTDKNLILASTQLTPEDPEKNLSQVRQTAAFVDSAGTTPVIVTGDFRDVGRV